MTAMPSLFDLHPEAAPIPHPDQLTVFDCIAEVEAEQAQQPPADLLAVVREHFDAIWNGTAGGFSRQQLEEGLADSERTLTALEAGTIRPQRVVGQHVRKPKTAARDYLHLRIAEQRRDLATEGRTNSVNVANVRHRVLTTLGDVGEVADHRLRAVTDRVNISNTLWKLTCTCGDSECGYSRVYPDLTARKVEEHMAGRRPLR